MKTVSRSQSTNDSPLIRRRTLKEDKVQENLVLEELVVIADSRRGKTLNGETIVSVNPKLKRMTLYKTTKNLMAEKSGQEFDHVLLLKSPTSKDKFWIRPCNPNQPGARKLNSNGVTKTLSCSMLLHEVSWDPEKTVNLDVKWDDNYNALKVEVPKEDKDAVTASSFSR